MLIRQKLTLNALAATAMALVLACVILLTLTKADEEQRLSSAYVEILDKGYALNVLTDAYRLNPNQRVIDQWRSVHASLDRLLRTMDSDAQASSSIAFIKKYNLDLKPLFERLVGSSASSDDPSFTREQQDRITTEMWSKIRSMTDEASKLVQASNERADESAARSTRVTMALIGALILVIMLMAFFASRTLTRSLYKLMQGTREVSQGNLDYTLALRSRDEFGQVAESFNAMTRNLLAARRKMESYTSRLEQTNRELQEFSQVAAHDLQEPLRKIMIFGERMLDQNRETLAPESLDHLERMTRAAQRMRDLVEAIQILSQVSSIPLRLEIIDLDASAREVLEIVDGEIKLSKATITVFPLPRIEADQFQMRLLLKNLIDNSLKFHEPGHLPEIKLSSRCPAQPDGPPSCEITIEDNGIGFDEKYLAKIFQPFQRLHARSQYQGTGIGLAICRRIVERHHGRIAAKSTPGKGARFIVTLPLRQPV